MNDTLKKFYQAEYESNVDITLESLAFKYGFEIEDLGDTSSWAKKPTTLPTKSTEIEIIPRSTPSTPTQTDDELKEDINKFKRGVIKESLARLKMAGMMETKELKELTTVVDMVDKSLRSTADGANVNVLIQNIINKYGDDV